MKIIVKVKSELNLEQQGTLANAREVLREVYLARYQALNVQGNQMRFLNSVVRSVLSSEEAHNHDFLHAVLWEILDSGKEPREDIAPLNGHMNMFLGAYAKLIEAGFTAETILPLLDKQSHELSSSASASAASSSSSTLSP